NRLMKENAKIGAPAPENDLALGELLLRVEETLKRTQQENQERQQLERELATLKTRHETEAVLLQELQGEETMARSNWEQIVAPLGLTASSGPEEAQAILNEIGTVF